MPPAPALPTAPGKAGGRSPLGWLKTREGKITAGAGAVLAVVLLALRRSGGSVGGGVPLQGQVDQTLQDRLDQFGMSGGTLEGLIGSVDALAGSVDQLRDLQDSQNPLPPTTPKPAASSGFSVRRIGKVGQRYSLRSQAERFSPNKSPNAVESFLRQLVKANPQLKGKTHIPGGFALKVPK